LPERAAHHREVIAALKQALGIRRIELVIPTHYHGDHIENIPELVALEGAEVVCLDIVAEVLEHPERFNLACALPWYGTNYRTVPVNRRVADGTRVRWREYELEIFHLAGQTYYHAGIATQIGDQRVMFVGDAFNAHAGVEGLLCYNDHEPTQRGWAYALDRIAERQPDLLVCGHVAVVGQPMLLVEIKRRLWRDQMARFARLSARADLRLFFDPFSGVETRR
jgi:glyoxylase-like metal-dependent hydrolase (beta-lactamase superfamily II)